MRRRKKRKTSASVKKKTQPRPLSFANPAPSSASPFQQPLAPPTTNINNNININIGHGASRRHCPYCGRHFRSLARHLEKHHDQQPEVRAAMELSVLPANATPTDSFLSPAQPSSSSLGTPLFSREQEPLSSPSKPGAVSFSLSVSPPPNTSKKTNATPMPTRKGVSKSISKSVSKCAVTHTPPPPARRGRPPKREKELQQKKQEEMEKTKEEAQPTPGKEEEEEENKLHVKGDGEEKNGEMTR